MAFFVLLCYFFTLWYPGEQNGKTLLIRAESGVTLTRPTYKKQALVTKLARKPIVYQLDQHFQFEAFFEVCLCFGFWKHCNPAIRFALNSLECLLALRELECFSIFEILKLRYKLQIKEKFPKFLYRKSCTINELLERKLYDGDAKRTILICICKFSLPRKATVDPSSCFLLHLQAKRLFPF